VFIGAGRREPKIIALFYCCIRIYEKKALIFVSTNNKTTITMKNFTTHQAFENQDLKVEINFFGLVKITEKEEGTSTIKSSNTADALEYWTNYFSEESKRGNYQIR